MEAAVQNCFKFIVICTGATRNPYSENSSTTPQIKITKLKFLQVVRAIFCMFYS